MNKGGVVGDKRKYTKVSEDEFLRIAGESDFARQIVEKTGMSYSGVMIKLKTYKAAGKEIKDSLLARQPRNLSKAA